MLQWIRNFQDLYPNVVIQMQGSGSATAVPALTQGAVDLALMSRPMHDREQATFVNRYGYPPTAIPVAIDAIAVYVHRDNPITVLSMQQLDAIFSATYRCSDTMNITTWGEVGLHDAWAQRTMQLIGRNSASGTYDFFKTKVLCGGDTKSNVNELLGSGAVVQAVASSLNGIGYAGIIYQTVGVHTVALSTQTGQTGIAPTTANIADGSYPLSRYLYFYVNKPPDQPLSHLESEFIRFVLSGDGQAIVLKEGYIPLPAKIVQQTLIMLGL
jgi:phosphate transport system substrate-binding protein